jgi:dTMP kinase
MRQRMPFICLEGIDGAGKTTLRNLIWATLLRENKPCIAVGQHSWLDADAAVELAAARHGERLGELGLLRDAYLADKLLHLTLTIVPALNRAIVLCDRFVFSDAVYQHVLYGTSMEATLTCYLEAGGRWPDNVLWITADAVEAGRRVVERARPTRHYEHPAALAQLAEAYENLFLQIVPNLAPGTAVSRVPNPRGNDPGPALAACIDAIDLSSVPDARGTT